MDPAALAAAEQLDTGASAWAPAAEATAAGRDADLAAALAAYRGPYDAPPLPDAPADPAGALLTQLGSGAAPRAGVAGVEPAAPPASAQPAVDAPVAGAPVPDTGNKRETAYFQQEADRFRASVDDEAQAVGAQKAALDELSRLDAEAARAEQELRDFEAGTEQQKADLKRKTAAELAEVDARIEEAAMVEPDPKRWWANRSAFQRIMLGMSAALSGGTMRSHGGQNQVLAMVRHEIDRDVALQQGRIDRELSALRGTRTGIRERGELEMEALGAEYAARNARYAGVLAGLRALRTRPMTDSAKANIDQTIAKLNADRAQQNMAMGGKLAQLRIAREQMWNAVRLQRMREEHAQAMARAQLDAQLAAPRDFSAATAVPGLMVRAVGPRGEESGRVAVGPGQMADLTSVDDRDAVNSTVEGSNFLISTLMQIRDISDLRRRGVIDRTVEGEKINQLIGRAKAIYIEKYGRALTDLDLKALMQGVGVESLKQVWTAQDDDDKRAILQNAIDAIEAQTEMALNKVVGKGGHTFGYKFTPTADYARWKAESEAEDAARQQAARDEREKGVYGYSEKFATAQWAKLVRKAERELAGQLGREPTDAERADAGIPTLDQFMAALANRESEAKAAARAAAPDRGLEALGWKAPD